MTTFNVAAATTTELLAFFNANSGIAAVKRFADRRSAEKRVNALLAERQFNTPAPLPEVNKEDAENIRHYGVSHCPACGCGLGNGVGHDGQEVNNEVMKHMSFQFECLSCNTEFGPLIVRQQRAPANKVGPRPAMAESLKLNREIIDLSSGTVYKNANRVYIAGLVSSAQGDRLSALLYAAAKTGDRTLVVTVNKIEFRLAFA